MATDEHGHKYMQGNARPDPIADSVETAAFRLGIGRAQLYKEIKAGRLRVRKLGRRTLVPRQEQTAWLAALPLHVPA